MEQQNEQPSSTSTLPALPPEPAEAASTPSTKPGVTLNKKTLLLIGGLVGLVVLVGAVVLAVILQQQAGYNAASSSSTSYTSYTASDLPTSASSTSSSTAEGRILCDDLTGICFGLPDQGGEGAYDGIQAETENIDPKVPKQWYFESKTYTEAALLFTDQLTYQNLAIVRSPGRYHLSAWACDGYCAEQTVISISVVNDSQSLDQAMTKFEQALGAAEDPYFDETPKIGNKQKIEKWGYPAYSFKITGGAYSDQETYYLLSNGKQLFYVSFQPFTEDSESLLVLDSLTLPK